MAAPIRLSNRLPLVVILGATGSGKSKLALELGRIFKGEIISADSMQIYKGLDVVTNKVTKEELEQCPHHMIDYLDPVKENFTVVDFRDKAVPIIDKIFQSKKIPIIVGGTNYYIESLVWNTLINHQDVEKATEAISSQKQQNSVSSSEDEDSDDSYRQSLEQEDSMVLHRKLMEVDRRQAELIHPHCKRKIIRALEVYNKYGVEMSKILDCQKSETEQESLRGRLRYDNTCIFWIQAEKNILEERTDKRVDEMIAKGLLNELQDFHKQYNIARVQENNEVDYTHGIFQSIGFKEFHQYLLLPDSEKLTKEGQKLLHKGIEDMKLVTRQYARKQVRWVRNRFLKYKGSQLFLPPVYGLDSTDVSQWEEHVHKPAVNILTAVIKGEKPDHEPLPVEKYEDKAVYNVCDVCNMVFTRKQEWEAHIKGRRHSKMLRAKTKREAFEVYKRLQEQKPDNCLPSSSLKEQLNKFSSKDEHSAVENIDPTFSAKGEEGACDVSNTELLEKDSNVTQSEHYNNKQSDTGGQ